MTSQAGHDTRFRAEAWQRIARRIRVPLGFLTAAVYLFEIVRTAPHLAAIGWSLLLVIPGVALRAAASGTVKKNQELTVAGPYAHTRNPLYLGSSLIAAGFALALFNVWVALLIAAGFTLIYASVIASEERFLRATFPQFDAYCRAVPRFLPRLTPGKPDSEGASPAEPDGDTSAGGFSPALYLQHREYNAALGAVLLYLSLLFLRPLLDLIRHGIR
jgi:protein-S-isoprenylcysteine O-methyltransferase Ste14